MGCKDLEGYSLGTRGGVDAADRELASRVADLVGHALDQLGTGDVDGSNPLEVEQDVSGAGHLGLHVPGEGVGRAKEEISLQFVDQDFVTLFGEDRFLGVPANALAAPQLAAVLAADHGALREVFEEQHGRQHEADGE